jgi:hypothetical protein
LDVWFDKHLKSGADWDDALEEQIRSNDHMVIVLSETSAASDNVKNEMRFAMDLGKRIHPILYKPCSVPLSMRRMHYIDFTNMDYDLAVKRLVDDINGEPMKEGSTSASHGKKKKHIWKPIVLSIIGAMAIGIGVWKLWPSNDQSPEEVVKTATNEKEELIEPGLNEGQNPEEAITPPPAISINTNWDTRKYKSKYDRSKISQEMKEPEVWQMVFNDKDHLFEGLLYYLERYGRDGLNTRFALQLFMEQFDKFGYVMYEDSKSSEGPFFKPYIVPEISGNELRMKVGIVDRTPQFIDIVIGVRDQVSPIYNGIHFIHDDTSLTGDSLDKDQMAVIAAEDLSGKQLMFGGNLWFKIKYRDYK